MTQTDSKSIAEILHTLYEDILVSESELAEGDRRTSLETVDQALKEATGELNRLLEEAKRETAKAFGGCEKCYGKGYSTVWSGVMASPDFFGEKGYVTEPKSNIKFCDCERGKQLKDLLELKKEKI